MKRRVVETALVRKGMVPDPDGGHHKMFRLDIDGATQLVTRISHGVKEIDDNIASLIARQCALQNAEFARLVECTLSADDWHELVRKRCASGLNPFLF